MNTPTSGLHHVTAIASDGPRNLAFYRDLLGLRFVKKTVNFDVPDTYHLYYGNEEGAPGTAMTFFLWPHLPQARAGYGITHTTRFAVPAGALPHWETHLQQIGVAVTRSQRLGEEVLLFDDPDGLHLGISERGPAADSPAILGFDGVELQLRSFEPTLGLLRQMGYQETVRESDRIRLQASSDAPWGRQIDLFIVPGAAGARQGLGSVHHIAFRAADDAQQAEFAAWAQQQGLQPSPVMDRNYFRSIYFREPGGILFEVATDAPGFTVDEPLETLGTTLKLPPQYESQRKKIEALLTPLETV